MYRIIAFFLNLGVLQHFVNFLTQQFHEHQQLFITIGIGAVCGLLSQMLMPGRGFGMFPTIVIGVLGCFLGNMFVRDHLTFIHNATARTFASGTLGAMALSLVINLFRGGKDKDKTGWRNNT